MRLIELTQVDGLQQYIHDDAIVSIVRNGERAIVVLSNGREVRVEESVEQVAAILGASVVGPQVAVAEPEAAAVAEAVHPARKRETKE